MYRLKKNVVDLVQIQENMDAVYYNDVLQISLRPKRMRCSVRTGFSTR